MTLTATPSTTTPYVTLVKTGTDGEYAVTRTVAGVVSPVRGTLVVSGGTGNLIDREAPQGVSALYTAGADTDTKTTPSVGAWLIHPTTSSLDTAVVVQSYPEWRRDVPQDSVTPLGSKHPIVVSGTRQARQGDVALFVDGNTPAGKVEAILESSRVLLLSTNHYQAGAMWVVVGSDSWSPLNPAKAAASWTVTLPLTEIDRPETISSGVVTWLDVAIRFPGSDGFDDLATTYGTFDNFWADAENWTS